jgi:hypothetical protein
MWYEYDGESESFTELLCAESLVQQQPPAEPDIGFQSSYDVSGCPVLNGDSGDVDVTKSCEYLLVRILSPGPCLCRNLIGMLTPLVSMIVR